MKFKDYFIEKNMVDLEDELFALTCTGDVISPSIGVANPYDFVIRQLKKKGYKLPDIERVIKKGSYTIHDYKGRKYIKME